ncbi:MAG: helix-turn-helix transcriptional regulator [Deltaproteobacteria bacterium]|nr:helix-turn-helix transcriptional regulator [Deltaproteobacteria bacterium]
MNEEGTFERILASLHEAALDPARWPGASLLIDEALGTHGSSLVCAEGESVEDIRFHLFQTYFRGERHPEVERLYLETYYPLDEQVPRVLRAPFNRLFRITDFYTEQELKTSEAYNAHRTHGHAGDAIEVRLRGSHRLRILWQVSDPVDGDGWSSGQLDRIRGLLPHIRHFLRVQQTLAGADVLGEPLTDLLEVSGLGIMQLDGRGRIVAVNDHARDLLRTGNGVLDRDGLLCARLPRDNDGLQRLLNRALPQFGVRGAGGSTVVTRADTLLPLVLHVHPVEWQKTDFPFAPVGALVLVVDPVSGTAFDPALVAAALGLTGMESRVAILLAQGMSVRDIAKTTGRKESTIRSHVKHIFAKHGLSRQAELVRLVGLLARAPKAGR